jgi:hypothetical protein
MSDLIKRAELKKHRQFQFLQNWHEYSNARKIRRAHILLVASLKKSTKKLLKKYCKAIAAGNADVTQLIAYRSIKQVLSFYEEELKIISDMIEEYESYLASGNWSDFIFCTQRPLDKLWDHRGE